MLVLNCVNQRDSSRPQTRSVAYLVILSEGRYNTEVPNLLSGSSHVRLREERILILCVLDVLMPTIRQLPPGVVNKIAAGEVIERPASVVKELLENAVDAGANRIDVTIIKGGSELIRVVDTGCGISTDQLSLAVASHATSKIQDADDLFKVATMGFRGEALASISEVSRFRLKSRVKDADEGAELVVDGGILQPVQPCGMPPGTVVEIRDLFFNTPVRRKFLRTPQTELGHVTEAFNRIALAWPNVHFRLIHGQRVIHDLSAVDDWRDRVIAIFGNELSDVLIPITGEANQMQLSGFVADPVYSRSHTRMQYLLLNGRFIRDRALQHALAESYRGLLLTGRYPVCFLRIDIPTDWVDVNVHPTKLEVRFQDSGQIYRHMLNTLRSKFLSTDLTARIGSSSHIHDEVSSEIAPSLAVGRSTQLQTESPHGLPWNSAPAESPSFAPKPLDETHPEWTPTNRFVESDRITVTPKPPTESNRSDSESGLESVNIEPNQSPPSGLQLLNRYLVAEDESGIVVIDQHALHERVLYEALRDRVINSKLERQPLLVPEMIDLRPEEHAAVMQARELLAELGIEVEDFGGDTVVVSSYPAILGQISAETLLRQAIESLLNGNGHLERRDLLDELLHMMSCKAAVKAGDRLSQEEVEALLSQRHLCQDAHHCPHGRPTALIFTPEELDRRFQRT